MTEVARSTNNFTRSNINTDTNLQPYITILSNDKNKPFGKIVYFNTNTNQIDKKSGIMAGVCQAETVKISDLPIELPNILKSLKSHQAIIYGWVPGTENGEPFFIYSKNKCGNIGGPTSVGLYTDVNGLRHARWTKDNFQFSTITMFDIDYHDSFPYSHINDQASWLQSMDTIYPAFSALTRVTYSSSSARIIDATTNTPIFKSDSFHIVVEIDPTIPHHDDRHRWRHGLLTMASKANLVYLESYADGMKSKPMSIWDPVVLASTQRISYDSAPTIDQSSSHLSHLSVVPPTISTYKGDYFNTTIIPTVGQTDIRHMNSLFRTNITLNSRNSLQQTEPTLRLDQVLDTQHYGSKTVLDLIETSSGSSSSKVRCQANWRNSTSWNAYFDVHKNGEPLVFDQGRDIKYVLSMIETTKLKTHMANKRIQMPVSQEIRDHETKIHQEFAQAAQSAAKKSTSNIIDMQTAAEELHKATHAQTHNNQTHNNQTQQAKVSNASRANPQTSDADTSLQHQAPQTSIQLPNESREWYETRSTLLIREALKLSQLEVERVKTCLTERTNFGKQAVSRLVKDTEDNMIREARLEVGAPFSKQINSVKDIEKAKEDKAKRDSYQDIKAKENDKIIHRLKENYCFIKGINKFYDVSTHTALVPQAFNQVEEGAIDFSSGRPKEIQASSLFKQQGGEVVDGLTWVPNRPGKQPKTYLTIGSRRFCNTYYHPHNKTVFDPNLLVPIQPFFDHVSYLMPDERERDNFFDHMAFSIQKPDVKINWQIVWFGETRIGKDLALNPLAWYFGNLYNDIDPDDREASKWGDMFAKRKIVVYQEVHRPGERNFSNSLKTKAATTGSGTSIFNMKGGAVIEHKNLMSMYLMSNYPDPIHMDEDDGRYFVISSKGIYPKSGDYYKKIVNWLRKGEFKLHKSGNHAADTSSMDGDFGPKSGVHRVIQWLMARDLSHFNPGKLPYTTKAKQDVIETSHSDIIIFAKDKLEHAEGLFDRSMPVITVEMLAEYLKKKLNRSINSNVLRTEMHVLKEAGLIKIDKPARITANKSLNRKEQSRTIWRNPNYDGPEPEDDYVSPSKSWNLYLKARENMKGILGAAANGF